MSAKSITKKDTQYDAVPFPIPNNATLGGGSLSTSVDFRTVDRSGAPR